MSQNQIKEQLLASASVLEEMSRSLTEEIKKAAGLIVEAIKGGGKLVLFGNGGSAADAQHIAAEIVGRFKSHRRGLPAIALTTNASILTAVSNDFGYETVFARQVEALGRPEDVFVGISTSGNSPNILLALDWANQLGGKTIALTGARRGKLDKVADLVIKIPSEDTPRIQEGHIAVGHIICGLVEEAVLGDGDDE